ncbi:MAG: ATP-binding protein [Myxococcales bacterium]|nr:ATP-binding protein [Myxococcota bacterium]MDW8280983.1 ATP-binding protein [Myxococcales bacterium]
MKIGTRVTLLTGLPVVLTISLYGYLGIRAREGELRRDLERQTQLFGSSLQVALEAALQEGLYEDVRHLIQRMQKTEQPVRVVYLDLVHPGDSAAFGPAATQPRDTEETFARPLPDPGRASRLRRVQINGQPYGEHITVGGRPFYAYMVPLRSNHALVGVVDLLRDEGEAAAAMRAFSRQVLATVAVLSVLLILMVSFTVRQAFAKPLLRLVGGIDEVTRGDYTGVILRERDDEVGLLADRFNEMTRSLREAREQILAGVDAKLQLEMRLRQADKLATIGQLAAGIAHEVGTPLNVIGGRARAMARRADDPQAVQKNAEIIAAQAERITKIIQQLLDYARSKAPARGRVDLERIAAMTLDFLEHQLATARVVARLVPFVVVPPQTGRLSTGWVGSAGAEPSGEVPLPPPTTPVVVGDPDQLQQVCLNLCLNAVQAMPEGGELQLSLFGLVRRRPGLDRSPPGAYVMLAVSDTGMGIPEEDKERIFEPFYSTKLHGPGAGLGLSVSAGIIKDHDGWIEIDSCPGGGTTFRVYLPAPEIDEDERLDEHGATNPEHHQASAAVVGERAPGPT